MSHSPPKLIYGIEDKPSFKEAIPLGFQHYLTMFGSTVAIPFILADALGASSSQIGQLIGTIFFVSGIATYLQATFGNRLPIIQGGTFSFLAPTIAICGMAGLADAGFEVKMQQVQGAIIAGSVFEILIGATGAVGILLRFVSPIVIAPTIALIGLALFQFGATKSGAGGFWPIGGLVIGLIIAFSQYLRGYHRAFSLYPVLLGILITWGTCIACSKSGVFQPDHPAFTDFSNVREAPVVRIPYPFQWGMPRFTAIAIVGMLAGYIASVIESVGDYYACARLSGAPIPGAKQVNRGITFEGIGCMIAGIFGSGNGTTSYSENIGAIGLTRVGSRRVVQCGAGIMILLSVFGKFGALFSTIPQPIVGGMYCVMFGMIASVGLSNLQFVDLNSARNLFIIGFSIFMGLSVPEYFKSLDGPLLTGGWTWLGDMVTSIGLSGMSVGAIISLFLDNTIPGTDEERGLTSWKAAA